MSRLDWPAELDRTPFDERTQTSKFIAEPKFVVTLGSAIRDLEAEIDRFAVDDWLLSTAMPHRKTDGLPYASAADPADSGAVL